MQQELTVGNLPVTKVLTAQHGAPLSRDFTD